MPSRNTLDALAKLQRHLQAAVFFERDIGLRAHIERAMPMFATLRHKEGTGLATAMVPTRQNRTAVRPIIVGYVNGDPYAEHGPAIEALGRHLGLVLDRARCFPYAR